MLLFLACRRIAFGFAGILFAGSMDVRYGCSRLPITCLHTKLKTFSISCIRPISGVNAKRIPFCRFALTPNQHLLPLPHFPTPPSRSPCNAPAEGLHRVALALDALN